MQLRSVQIRNFRSIEDVSFEFQPRCRMLVGPNEAGKSNILDALALLDPTGKTAHDNVRETRHDEDYDQPAFVAFSLGFEKAESDSLLTALLKRVLPQDADVPMFVVGGSQVSLRSLCESGLTAELKIDVRSSARSLSLVGPPPDLALGSGWRSVDTSAGASYAVRTADGTVPLSSFLLVRQDTVNGFHRSAFLPEETAEPFVKALRVAADPLLQGGLPRCIRWRHDDKYLLPSHVTLSEFAANPDSCPALKSLFQLGGVNEISKKIAESRKRTMGLTNLLDRVSENATKYLHAAWTECKGVRVLLRQNGEQVDCAIQDHHNAFEMKRRSEGFKRFITFLLMVSATFRSTNASRVLFLQDEPEASLHPSGIRDLRNELLRISNGIWVVCATHSPFMIDGGNVSRHLIVEKTGEVTKVSPAGASDVLDQEVLFNALGCSAFENIRPLNIIFEGWTDKQLFRVAVEANAETPQVLVEFFRAVGTCHAQGVKDIRRIAALIDLTGKKYVVVTDGDQAAKQRQQEFKGDGRWVRYDEVCKGGQVSTVEDFLNTKAFARVAEKLRHKYPGLASLEQELEPIKSMKLTNVKRAIAKSVSVEKDVQRALHEFKDLLFESLTPSGIAESYFSFLEALKKTLEEGRSTQA